ncbi:MAG: hypothetical protein Q4E39_04530 [bacterium]|nr:hypothetical protein [Bacilli bacterium]MDO5003475.1 hypothetical protein [bacterium]
MKNKNDEIKMVNTEEIYVTMEQLEPILSESGYSYYAHGTGRKGNDESVVDSIFEMGLRTKDNSLYKTSKQMGMPTLEMISKYQELGLNPPTLEEVENEFNNWDHKDSKKIIILRLPNEYINQSADNGDLQGEKYGAFMTEMYDENQNMNLYVDSQFIIGCYDVEKQAVRINKKFERIMSEDTLSKVKERYKKVLEITKKRLQAEPIFEGYAQILNQLDQQDVQAKSQPISQQEIISDFGDDIDWGFPTLDENEKHR